MASGRMAPKVFSVSTRDSPLAMLEEAAAMEMASAPRRLAASSKLVRVRVEASKNRFTMVRPRRVSKRLRARRGRAESVWSVRGWLRSRCVRAIRYRAGPGSCSLSGFGTFGLVHALDEQHFLLAVDFLEFHFDDLFSAGLDGASDVAGFDGELAVSAVD